MLPVNLFVIRHGESLGNLAKRMSERGDNSLLEKLHGTHTAHWPLTKKGVEQAKAAGAFMNALSVEQKMFFNRIYVSSFARAMETAGHLDLPSAGWLIEDRITERNWGSFDHLTEEERQEKFGNLLDMRQVEPFFWSPPDGEDFNNLVMRIRNFITSMDRVEINENVVVVCHGEVMKAFRIVFTHMKPWEYADMEFSKESLQRIHNCQIDHYSRRDPEKHEVSRRLEWLQVYRPAEGQGIVIPWHNLPQKRMSSDELLAIAGKLSKDLPDL